MTEMSIAQIPVTILTGFLGAGKTTLLNALLRDPAFRDTAVLINEFGSVAIDHDLIAEFDEDMIVTSTGCLCCAASSNVRQSLFELMDRRRKRKIRHFERVIVETSGLVDPVPIVATFLKPPSPNLMDKSVAEQFALARVVTLFDCINGPGTLDRHTEAMKQAVLADVLVLTKSDLDTHTKAEGSLAALRERLGRLNPGAPILDRQTDWDSIRDTLLAPRNDLAQAVGAGAMALLAKAELAEKGHSHAHDHSHAHHQDHEKRHADAFSAQAIVLDQPVHPNAFKFFLDMLRLIAGPNLLRLKGLIALSDDPDRPLVVHGVQHTVHPVERLSAWPSEDHRTRIVLIGRNLNVEAMRKLLTAAKPATGTSRPA